MSKIILEFDSIEESDDARVALDGWKWRFSMSELDQWLRNECKHQELSKETYESYEKIREKIREILNDNELVLKL